MEGRLIFVILGSTTNNIKRDQYYENVKRKQVENIKIYYRGTEVDLCEVSYEPESDTVKINFN